MKAIRAVRALGPIDAKSVYRDPLLRWLLLYPAMYALVIRWGLPILSDYLAVQFQFDLSPFHPLIASFLLLIMPVMVGMVIGFLLLDQRDDQTITALQVTPLSLNGYLAYRLTAPVVISILISLAVIPLSAIPGIRLDAALAASLLAAPLAPILALFIASVAQNKVQGFALMKSSGAILLPPLVAYFVQPPLQWAFGVVPTYWPAKLYWMIHGGEPFWWAYLLVGLGYQLLVLAALLKRFDAVMHR